MHSPIQSFLEQSEACRREVGIALERYTEFDDDCPESLRRAIRHSLLAPGKRLRPLLVLMSAEACGSDWKTAMPAACAVEMVHTYSLIHDDLPAMDDDSLRRGLPTCHVEFGEANAILAGDALLARAFEILATDVRPAPIAARCCAELGKAAGATALVGGQVDDLRAEASGGDADRLEAIHRRKTGALLVVALRLGAIVADADDSRMSALTRYGRKLGLAFQITDDLLDVVGRGDAMGKQAQKDGQRGKLTFPSLLGVEESRRRAERLVEEACRSLAGIKETGGGLIQLARYVLERNH